MNRLNTKPYTLNPKPQTQGIGRPPTVGGRRLSPSTSMAQSDPICLPASAPTSGPVPEQVLLVSPCRRPGQPGAPQKGTPGPLEACRAKGSWTTAWPCPALPCPARFKYHGAAQTGSNFWPPVSEVLPPIRCSKACMSKPGWNREGR